MDRPLTIFIVGTTAVGKTKLSIQLAKLFGGEIINCDSKQLYKHAGIMTAKATAREQEEAPHRMLDVLELHESTYNRNKYFEQAWKHIQEVKSQGKVPIVIGGTNYYLEMLLYDVAICQPPELKQIKSEITRQYVQSLHQKQEKYELLKKVDPKMAEKLHPNDQTRVTNFLIRYAETGIPPSETYKPYVNTLRCKDSVLFWLQNSNKAQLYEMMASRIDTMLKQEQEGLLEILSVFQYAKNKGIPENKGILQSIGYKQFQDIYKAVEDMLEDCKDAIGFEDIKELIKQKMPAVRTKLGTTMGVSIRTGKQVQLLERCKEILVRNTADYSKRQLTWIKNRLFSAEENSPHFFTLDLAGKESIQQRFKKNILIKACQTISIIKNQGFGSIKSESGLFQKRKHDPFDQWKKYRCDLCEKQLNGIQEWEEHLVSRKHRKSGLKKERKHKKNLEKLAAQQVIINVDVTPNGDFAPAPQEEDCLDKDE